jgi:hypothetical protein
VPASSAFLFKLFSRTAHDFIFILFSILSNVSQRSDFATESATQNCILGPHTLSIVSPLFLQITL